MRPRGGSLAALLLGALVLQPQGHAGGWHAPRGRTGSGGVTVAGVLIYPVKPLWPFNLLGGGKQIDRDFHGVFSQLELGVNGCFLVGFPCFSISPRYISVNKFNEVK